MSAQVTKANQSATLTVRELIDQLYALPELDKPILFGAPSRDYWQTRLAYRFIANNVSEIEVKWDEYHGEYAVRDPEDDEDDYGDGTVYVFC